MKTIKRLFKKDKSELKLTKEEFAQLQKLLDKLRAHLGGNRYCLIPNCFAETASIAVYDSDGNLAKSEIGHDVESAVQKILKQ